MNALTVSGLLFVTTVGGYLLGLIMRAWLPEPHLSSDARDVVKMGTGLVATVTGLVLGLLTASAKSSFDGQRASLQQMAANIVLLDRELAHFGADGANTRQALRAMVATLIDHVWPADGYRPSGWNDAAVVSSATALLDTIRHLPANNEALNKIKGQAIQDVVEIARQRWQLNRWEDSSIPIPFLAVLNMWLAFLFMIFGVFTPRNLTVVVLLLVCAVSVAGALFLIVELDQPFEGMIHITNTSLRNALAQLGK